MKNKKIMSFSKHRDLKLKKLNCFSTLRWISTINVGDTPMALGCDVQHEQKGEWGMEDWGQD